MSVIKINNSNVNAIKQLNCPLTNLFYFYFFCYSDLNWVSTYIKLTLLFGGSNLKTKNLEHALYKICRGPFGSYAFQFWIIESSGIYETT